MASTWDTKEMASALESFSSPADGFMPSSVVSALSAPAVLPDEQVPTRSVDPQAHGWTAPVAYDYELYKANKTDRPTETEAAVVEFDATIARRADNFEWAGNASVYEWKDEYGDVGPRIPELEAALYGKASDLPAANWDGLSKIPVTQEGTIQIAPAVKFENAGLHPVMLENIALAGYSTPTPVQQYTLPSILKNYDIIACAQTGSGKTAAFLIPVLSRFMGKAKKLAAPRPNPATFDLAVHGQVRAEPLALVICPTRELATQTFTEARKFCYRTMLRPAVIYGGTPLIDQITQLSKGADILIGTPGRLVDFLNRPQLLSFRRLRYIIIDEADEMLHSDWEAELKIILSGGDQEPGNITYLMFSATFPKSVRDLAKEYLKKDHVRIRVGRIGSSHENIKQDVVFVEPFSKKTALLDLLMSKPPARTIIFVNSKRSADEVDDFLYNNNIPCTTLHSDRTQKEREDSIRAFRCGACPVMIATGLSARGIDVPFVAHVINFELPSFQHGGIEEYTHRIGRTGRSGEIGYSTSFFSNRDEDLGPALVKTLCETHQPIPDFLHQHLPDGFTADGQGDVATLRFDADSDGEEDEGADDNTFGDNTFGDSAFGLDAGTGAPAWNAVAEANIAALPESGGAPARPPATSGLVPLTAPASSAQAFVTQQLTRSLAQIPAMATPATENFWPTSGTENSWGTPSASGPSAW